MDENQEKKVIEVPTAVTEVDGLKFTSFFQLADGRMEVNWEPTEKQIPQELEYLSEKIPMLVARTRRQSTENEDLMHYLFTTDAKWRGVRCPSLVWKLFLQAKGVDPQAVDKFLEEWACSPSKTLTLPPLTQGK